ncbi:MAG: pseudouridine synthase, partial [Chitinophagales bacterium]
MQLEILNETKEWIAVNKPSGLLVEENPYEISVEAILKEQHKYIGIVHRLDRVTSGVLILAKKKSALKILNKQFSD